MPTTHAQRIARVRRAPRFHGRLLHHVAYHMSVLPVRDVTPVSQRWQYANAAASTARREAANYAARRARRMLEQPFFAVMEFPIASPRAWTAAREAYVNKDLTDSWDEALRTDDDATPFMPEDWRLECVTSRDELPEYMGSDIDGLFL